MDLLRHVGGAVVGRLSRKTLFTLGAALFCLLVVPLVHRLLPVVSGLPRPIRPITVHTLSSDEFAARLRIAAREAMNRTVRCQRLALYDLRLVRTIEPNLQPHVPGLLDRAMGAPIVPAFYMSGHDTIYTLTEDDPTIQHEWVHAVDDQRGSRMRGTTRAATTDERMALRAAVEGTAVAALRAHERVLPLGSDLDENGWALAYTFGPRYVRSRAGTDVRRALELRPVTTYEIMFRTAPRRTQVRAAPLKAGERLLCTDRVGALGILTTLQRAGASVDDAIFLAESWTDDRLDVIATPTGRRYVWSVAFSDAAAGALWEAGPGVQFPLTSARIQTHAMVAAPARPPSFLDSLGK